jgi:predicted kinase
MTAFDLTALAPRAPAYTVDEAAVRAFLATGIGAEALAATPQDAIFHAEGDVWTHTRMVLDALVALPAWRGLDDTGRMVTFVASLLHDVGKPATTRDDGGKLTSRGHSARGELDVRAWLWRLGVPFGVREHVCALVRHHQVPFFGVTRGEADAVQLAARLSLRLRHDWLVLVAEADIRGRRCADPADQARIVDHVALWAEHCRELGVLDRPFGFPSPHTRVVYLEGEPAARSPGIEAFDDTVAEVVVMAGLPASGKDTWLARHRGDLPVVSLDAVRAELDVEPGDDQGAVAHAAREAARVHLRAGRSFAWNATNISARLRSQLLTLLRGYRARVHVVYCEAPAAEQRERNGRRPSPVPAAAIASMLERWTVPALDEVHAVTYAVGGEPGPVAWPPVAIVGEPSG